jgi:hypothetical protein
MKQVHNILYGNDIALTLSRQAIDVGPPGFPQDMSLLYLFVIVPVLMIDS